MSSFKDVARNDTPCLRHVGCFHDADAFYLVSYERHVDLFGCFQK